MAHQARPTTLLIADGVLPSNDGRGYVLRKIIRRGLRHGTLLGAKEPFLYKMVDAVRGIISGSYAEITAASAPQLQEIVKAEEQGFAHVLGLGEEKRTTVQLLVLINWAGNAVRGFSDGSYLGREKEFYRQLHNLIPGTPEEEVLNAAKILVGEADAPKLRAYLKQRFIQVPPIFPGDEAFKLYDTYGLPLDFIRDAIRDDGLVLDEAGFEKAMQEQRTRARASWKGGTGKEAANPAFARLGGTLWAATEFFP